MSWIQLGLTMEILSYDYNPTRHAAGNGSQRIFSRYSLWKVFLLVDGVNHSSYDRSTQAGRVIAAPCIAASRKVCTPQGKAPGNTRGGVTCQIGPQKHTAPRGVRVKRWCKRPPASAAMRRPGNPRQEQGQAGTRDCPSHYQSRVGCTSGTVTSRLER